MNVNCPSCRDTGKVTAEEAVRIYEAQPGLTDQELKLRGATCSCDGPPHSYDPPSPPTRLGPASTLAGVRHGAQ